MANYMKKSISFTMMNIEDDYMYPRKEETLCTVEFDKNRIIFKDPEGKEFFKMNEYDIRSFVSVAKAFYNIK